MLDNNHTNTVIELLDRTLDLGLSKQTFAFVLLLCDPASFQIVGCFFHKKTHLVLADELCCWLHCKTPKTRSPMSAPVIHSSFVGVCLFFKDCPPTFLFRNVLLRTQGSRDVCYWNPRLEKERKTGAHGQYIDSHVTFNYSSRAACNKSNIRLTDFGQSLVHNFRVSKSGDFMQLRNVAARILELQSCEKVGRAKPALGCYSAQ